MKKKKKSFIETVILSVAAIVAVAAAALLILFYTKPGKKFTSKVVASYLHGSVNYVSGKKKGNGGKNTSSGQSGNKAEEGQVTFEKPAEVIDEDQKEKEYYHLIQKGREIGIEKEEFLEKVKEFWEVDL